MKARTLAVWIAALFLASCIFSGTVALRLLLLFSGVAVCVWIALREGSVRALPPIWLPFVLWAAWAALSLTWSIDHERSIKEFRNEVVYTGLALWMCYVAAQARPAMKVVLAIVGLASAVACIIAVYHFQSDVNVYPGGAHGGSGNHSSLLLMLMPMVLAAAYLALMGGGERWIAAAAVLLGVLFLGSAYSTLNRTVWLGFALEAILIVALIARFSGMRLDRSRVLSLSAAVALISGGAMLMVWKTHVEREAAFGQLDSDPRVAIWREASERIGQNPLTGYGFGRGLLRRELTSETNDNFAWHSHNVLLDALIQVGIPGLALFLILLGAVIREALRMLAGKDAMARTIGVTLIAIVAGVLVRNMTDVLLVRHVALFFWGSIGMLLAWGAASRDT